MKRSLIILPLTAALGLVLTGCGGGAHGGGQHATQSEQVASNNQLALYNTVQPVPGFQWSQLRQNLIELERSQSDTTQTTSFFFNMGIADPIQTCPSIGFPISADTELTNPQQITNNSGHAAWEVVGNEDPNGVYQGQTTGTYVICVNAQGKAYADYWEGFVQTVTGAAGWDYTTHRMQPISNPTASFSIGK